MKCAIMQPTYLPWAGYFNLISQVDTFVFLDDVQYERRSWQSRNRILLQGREHVLTVPVNKAARSTPISQITVCNENGWQKSHWQILSAAYGKTTYGLEALQIIEPVFLDTAPHLLSEFNQTIIRKICQALRIETQLVRASKLHCDGKRSTHLIKICEILGCNEYLSPRGSSKYLRDDNFQAHTDTLLVFQDFTPIPYPQYRVAEFVSHLSVIDVIANNGLKFTRTYIK